ncbi:MAG: C4-dicarboxylate ABC transporter permease [Desulfitibacter sp. BRH_c19]|nr:MAG: C4-dicarboxylate ABC transporter permease [Desulfitibacter sp. BRH_c19]
MSVPIVLFSSFIFCLLIGVPISISIGISSLLAVIVAGGATTMVAQVAFTGNDGFAFLAVPMFILAGLIMERGGLSERIIKIASSIIGPMTGGLAIVTVFGSMFFGAMSGSGPATVAAMGGIMIPAMVRGGYNKPFAGAITACSGGLGVLIPPSIPLIIYGITVGTSITDLFLASIVPGIMVGVAMMIVSYYISRKNGWRGGGDEVGLRVFIKAAWYGKWAILAPIIILGGIYGGIFTPTEAGVVAVVYSIVVGVFIHKEMNLKVIPDIIINAAVMSSVVMIILGLSTAFGRIMTLYRIPHMMSEFILNYSANPNVILILISLLLLLLGTFMETGPIIIIFAPLLIPLTTSVGISPIFLGVLMCLTTQIGFMTPPLGCNLFVAQKIAGLGLGEIFKPTIPLLLAQLVVLLIIIIFPDLVFVFIK